MKMILATTILAVAEGASSSDVISPFIDQIVGLSGYGLLLLLYMTDRIHTKKAYDERGVDRDAWKTAYTTERDLRVDAEQELYKALEQLKLSNELLNAIKNGTQSK